MSIKKYKTGLVIGKFYPPHKGHKYLIDTAIKSCDQTTVLICFAQGEKIPGELRASWIREIHPQTEVILIDSIPEIGTKEEISKAWANYTIKILGYAPEAVFTSENYGQRYSKYLGSEHVLVDIDRKTFPCSGTLVRSNPLEHMHFVEPCVKAYFALRVCAIGAESTGTTTIAKALAEHYKTTWVPEFGRMYWEGKMNALESSEWRTDEFMFIASEQNELEDKLARTCNKFLFCDTDSFATSLWHERYMGFMSEEVNSIGDKRSYEIYFLTDVDIPFVQDGTRDGEHIRQKMHSRFVEELKRRNKKYMVLSGSHDQRLKKAIEECDKLLSEYKF